MRNSYYQLNFIVRLDIFFHPIFHIFAGCNPTTHGRLHIPAGTGEDETSVAKLSAEAVSEQARGRAVEHGQRAQETQNRRLHR